jgi:hypothetical protein
MNRARSENSGLIKSMGSEGAKDAELRLAAAPTDFFRCLFKIL